MESLAMSDDSDVFYQYDCEEDEQDDDEEDEDEEEEEESDNKCVDFFEIASSLFKKQQDRESGGDSINNNHDELVRPEKIQEKLVKEQPVEARIQRPLSVQRRSRNSNHVSKASQGRFEFWNMVQFCAAHSVPMMAQTANGRIRDAIMFTACREVDTADDKRAVVYDLRMRDKLAHVMQEEYKNNRVVMFMQKQQRQPSPIALGRYMFEMDLTDSDIIMHVRSQGKRDKPGTITGPTNCFCAKANGSKYNGKPIGNTLVVPMPDPLNFVRAYLERRAYFERISDKARPASCHVLFESDASGTVQGSTFVTNVVDYNKTENIFKVSFERARRDQMGSLWFAVNQRPLEDNIDGVDIVDPFGAPTITVHIQSDRAFLRSNGGAGAVVFRVKTVANTVVYMKLLISGASPFPKADNSKLIEKIPIIKPYVYVYCFYFVYSSTKGAF